MNRNKSSPRQSQRLIGLKCTIRVHINYSANQIRRTFVASLPIWSFMRSFLLSLACILFCTGSALAVPAQFAVNLQKELDSGISTLKIPGAVVVVTNDAGNTWTGVSGVAQYPNTSMTADLSLPIASVTKTMTSTIILQLVDEDKLTLDTVVESIFPGIVVNSSNITIRHLLSMRSGLGDYNKMQISCRLL